MLSVILFIVGFYILIKGARVLVDGASVVARVLSVPRWAIGIVVVGIGTSMPEFAINVAAVLAHDPIGVSTIIGSNIFNLLFILGLVAIISPPLLERKLVMRDLSVMLGAIVISAAALLISFSGSSFMGIEQGEAIVLVGAFILWVLWEIFGPRQKEMGGIQERFTLGYALFMIVFGIVGVVVGGEWVVDGALAGAQYFGVASSIIGLLVIGVGTSITELTVSVTAALKKRSDIAVGNIIGSNVFDFLGILGIAGLFGSIPFTPYVAVDLVVVILAVVLTMGVVRIGKPNMISRGQGVVLVLLYVLYVVGSILRVPFIG